MDPPAPPRPSLICHPSSFVVVGGGDVDGGIPPGGGIGAGGEGSTTTTTAEVAVVARRKVLPRRLPTRSSLLRVRMPSSSSETLESTTSPSTFGTDVPVTFEKLKEDGDGEEEGDSGSSSSSEEEEEEEDNDENDDATAGEHRIVSHNSGTLTDEEDDSHLDGGLRVHGPNREGASRRVMNPTGRRRASGDHTRRY